MLIHSWTVNCYYVFVALLTEWLCFMIDYVIEMKSQLNSMHISIYNLFILWLPMGLAYWSTSCSLIIILHGLSLNVQVSFAKYYLI